MSFKKELYEEIKNNLGAEEILSVINEAGVCVNISVNRKRGFSLPKEILKNKAVYEESRDFIDSNIKSGSINFLTEALEKDLKNIESLSRVKLARAQERSIATVKKGTGKGNSSKEDSVNGKFLFLEDFKVFLKEFESCKVSFYEKIDEISERWDDLMSDFIPKLEQTLIDLGMESGDVYEYLRRVPSAEEFKNKAHMSLRVTPIVPPIADIDLGDEELNEALSKSNEIEAVKALTELVTITVSKLFANCMTACKKLEKSSSFTTDYKRNFKESVMNVRDKNEKLFRFNEISDICEKLLDEDLTGEDLEECLIEIYEFAMNKKIQNNLPVDEDSSYNREFFNAILC